MDIHIMMAISIIAGHATIMKSLHSGTLVRSCRPKSAAGWPSGWIESAHLVASACAWGGGACAIGDVRSCLHPHPGKSLSCCFVCDSQGGNWYYFLMLGQLVAGRTSSARQGGGYAEERPCDREGARSESALLRLEGPKVPASSQFELSRLASRTPNAEADISCRQELGNLGTWETGTQAIGAIAFLTSPGQGVRVRECGYPGCCCCCNGVCFVRMWVCA